MGHVNANRRRMAGWRAASALLWSGMAVIALAPPPDAAAHTLDVSLAARALAPGEVVLIRITAPEPLASLDGEGFEKPILFHASVDRREWRGLLGIDLDTPAGPHLVAVRGRTAAGALLQAEHRLTVHAKAFLTRRLTVAPEYVTPPPGIQERIRRESLRVAAILDAITPERLWHGPFLRPVPGAATSSFGVRSILNNQPRSPHSGTDFRGAVGTPIQAPNAGRVMLADDLYFSGNAVILDHGQGLFSYFAHLSKLAVREGDLIEAGDIVGQVGATGRVTGPHLHWALRLVGARVDPLSLMAVLEEVEKTW
jgi:murein DD-endopeptidase MepM/ murein hydrolase activator NlpD